MTVSARMRLQGREAGAWYNAAICLGALLGLVALFLVPPALLWAEHWAADWRTAWLSERLPSSHPKIAIIDINEKSLEPYPYLVPFNRGFLADIIDAVDKAGARAIGLDFYFTRDTEKAADEKLVATVRRLKNKLVLGAYEPGWLEPERLSYQYAFIGDTPAGYIDLRIERDHVIRYRSDPPDEARFQESLSSRLARAGGWKQEEPPDRIAWLLKPADGQPTFLSILAHDLLKAAPEENAKLLKDRIVLIGGALFGLDRFWTPLSLRDRKQMPGIEVHAHMLAELIDGDRSYAELGPYATKAFLLVLAVLGFTLSLRFHERKFDFLDWRVVSFGVIAVDLLSFKFVHLVLPFTLASGAWICAVAAGTHMARALAWIAGRRKA
ncbi:MAG: CHASE2 domain-containing protein [Hyphomicrobiaceae bacterium]|nr:CHASE2 domain-containing protein [Hyphomicrobiaceae bacterium]